MAQSNSHSQCALFLHSRLIAFIRGQETWVWETALVRQTSFGMTIKQNPSAAATISGGSDSPARRQPRLLIIITHFG